MELLKLIALDEDDLKVLSVHLQDALVRMEDVVFLPRENRFAAVMKRFDWLTAENIDKSDEDRFYERRETALRFERVLGAQYRDLPLDQSGEVVKDLLAVDFQPTDPPGGFVDLIFAGGGAIRLRVECIEAEMRDLGAVWRTRRKPEHPDTAANTSQSAG